MADLLRDTEIGKVFTPATPVSLQDLFAGRLTEFHRVIDAMNQPGQHVVIFGERGVGKTSLANIVSIVASGPNYLVPRINCDSNDLYWDLWKKAFHALQKGHARSGKKANEAVAEMLEKANARIRDYSTPGDVVDILDDLSSEVGVAVIFDECDRIKSDEARTGLADTIKSLSDQDIKATIILVGVSDSVDDLIDEHQSLERALVQVQMPRMTTSELEDILDKGTKKLNMSIDATAKHLIATLSRGLPHYVHLLGRHAARTANQRNSNSISESDVRQAVSDSLNDVSASIRSGYVDAVSSVQKEAIFKHVLAACALAPSNELGWFSVASVRGPLNRITGKAYEIGGFTRHIGAFCESDRGPILERTGKKHNFKYRFYNPLMQPYAILRGIADGIINEPVESLIQS